jgi:hypothetical protein
MTHDIQNSSDLVIALYDYGGQSIFNSIHHLFLTTNGVYAVTFNIEWLLTEGPTLQAYFDYLDFWVNSIIVHTLNHSTMCTAPVVFVGTHKDKVTDPADHEKVSLRIFKRYSKLIFWPMVIENALERGTNGTTLMYFFPVDNTLSRSDPTMINLLTTMEEVMQASSFTNEKVPLAWLKTLDDIQSQDTSFLKLDDVVSMGGKYGVSESSTSSMLAFFNERGILFWLNEDGLRDVVIVDAIAYFVVPSTILICKHTPNENDPTSHLMGVHKKCRKHLMLEWNSFVEEGIVTERLLRGLWEDYAEEYDRLLQLMLKFGLMVSLTLTSTSEDGVNRYLVPSLLSTVDPTQGEFCQWTDKEFQSCMLVFTVDPSFSANVTIFQGDLRSSGFLPSGLFERIISKLLLWCQTTSRYSTFSHRNIVVHRNLAILHFGSQRFRLVACPLVNSIRVDVEGENPLAVHSALVDTVENAISECFKSLTCFTVLFHSVPTGGVDTSSRNTNAVAESGSLSRFTHESESSNASQNSFVIPMKHLLAAAVGRSPLMKAGGRRLFDADAIQQLYGSWLRVPKPLEKYMAFISYRWMPVNSQCVSLVYDMFSNFTVGDHHQTIDVFLDKKLLQAGRRFDFDFVKALSKSCVLMPVVSVETLERMSNQNVGEVDNVLLEWAVGLELVNQSAKKSCDSEMKAIFPLAFGKTTMEENKVRADNLFASDTYRSLPSVVPTATLKQAKDVLQSVHPDLQLSSGFMEQTIEGIVNSLMKYKGFLAWESPPEHVIENMVVECVKVIGCNLADSSTAVCQQQQQKQWGSDGASSIFPPQRVATTGGVDDGNPIMDFLRLDKNVQMRDELDALLEEWGAYEDQDVLDLDAEDIEKISACLRRARRKAFARLME